MAKTVKSLINDFCEVDYLQEAFNCIIVHREDVEVKKVELYQEELGMKLKSLISNIWEFLI